MYSDYDRLCGFGVSWVWNLSSQYPAILKLHHKAKRRLTPLPQLHHKAKRRVTPPPPSCTTRLSAE